MGRYRGRVPRARGGAAGSTSTLLVRTLSRSLHPHPPPSTLTLTLTLTQIRWATRSPYISATSPPHLRYISVQVGYEIHWKEGMDVTVKMVQKKQKKKGKTRTVQVGEIPSPPPHHHRHLTATTATSPPAHHRTARRAAGGGADRLFLPVLRPARAARGGDGRGGDGAAAGYP